LTISKLQTEQKFKKAAVADVTEAQTRNLRGQINKNHVISQ